jgi:hypothetical protein
MIDVDLKPCPLCGGRARHEIEHCFKRPSRVSTRGVIICNICKLRLEGEYGAPWPEVARKWNSQGGNYGG